MPKITYRSGIFILVDIALRGYIGNVRASKKHGKGVRRECTAAVALAVAPQWAMRNRAWPQMPQREVYKL